MLPTELPSAGANAADQAANFRAGRGLGKALSAITQISRLAFLGSLLLGRLFLGQKLVAKSLLIRGQSFERCRS